MFICRNCGKFSKKTPAQQKRLNICRKCLCDLKGPVQGGPIPIPTKPENLTEATGTVQLYPGFGGAIEFEPHNDFGEQKSPWGPARQQYVLRYAEAMDIPGTGYHHILPFQVEVHRKIVEAKMELIQDMQRKGEMLSVIVGKDENHRGLALIDDGHHRFVAALRLGAPILLRMGYGTVSGAQASWKTCVYVDEFSRR